MPSQRIQAIEDGARTGDFQRRILVVGWVGGVSRDAGDQPAVGLGTTQWSLLKSPGICALVPEAQDSRTPGPPDQGVAVPPTLPMDNHYKCCGYLHL
jgi:hypothetical protein